VKSSKFGGPWLLIVTTQSYRGYVFTLRQDPEDPGFAVDFPDIPKIITSHDKLAGAFANACEALDLCLETLKLVFNSSTARVYIAGS
jgi:predicted RNase H-like HicB family nuclease